VTGLAPRHRPKARPTVWRAWDGNLEAALAAALAAAAPVVMLTGQRPASGWLFRPAPAGWAHGEHFTDLDRPVGRFEHHTGARVELRLAAEWWPGHDLNPTHAAAAWSLLEREFVRAFRGQAGLWSTPGTTGVEAWVAATGPDRPGQLEPDLADLIRQTSPQHRVELVDHDDPPDELPGFAYLDARWSYAALTRELGSAPARMLTAEQAGELAAREPHARARYHVRGRVPDGWDHVGVLVCKRDSGDGWHAPRRPGEPFDTWVDAYELALAGRLGWTVDHVEAIALTQRRPLDTWTERLVRARQRILDTDPGPVGSAAAAAVRQIMLTALGGFHSTGRDTLTPITEEQAARRLPPDAALERHGSVLVLRRRRVLAGRAALLTHPEWSAAVWAKAHARLLEAPTGTGQWAGVLQLPLADVIGMRGDALYLTRDPGWPDPPDPAGRPVNGRYRLKGALTGPLPYPRTLADLNKLRAASEAAGTDTR